MAWLEEIAKNGFRKPDVEVRVGKTNPASATSGAPSPSPPRDDELRYELGVIGGWAKKDTDKPFNAQISKVASGSTDAEFIRDMPPDEVADQLRKGGKAFAQVNLEAQGVTDAQPELTVTHHISPAFAEHYVAMADDLARRLPALPVWTRDGDLIDQGRAGIRVANAYFYAARWYESQVNVHAANSHEAAEAEGEAQRLYQAALDAARNFGRSPGNIVIDSNLNQDAYRAFLAQIPDDVFFLLTVDGQSVTALAGHDKAAAIAKILEGQSADRDMPTALEIRNALFPAHVPGLDGAVIQKLIGDAVYELHRLERSAADGSMAKAQFDEAYKELSPADRKNWRERAAQAKFGKPYDKLKPDDQKTADVVAKESFMAADQAKPAGQTSIDAELPMIRNRACDRLLHYIAKFLPIAAKLRSAEELTPEEAAAVRQDVPEFTATLKSYRVDTPKYKTIAGEWSNVQIANSPKGDAAPTLEQIVYGVPAPAHK
jgi:hypothetical protein